MAMARTAATGSCRLVERNRSALAPAKPSTPHTRRARGTLPVGARQPLPGPLRPCCRCRRRTTATRPARRCQSAPYGARAQVAGQPGDVKIPAILKGRNTASTASIRLRELTRRLQEMLTCATAQRALARSSSRSAWFSWVLARDRRGTRRKTATAQTSPGSRRRGRHGASRRSRITQMTKGGVKAPPQRALSHMIPWARVLSWRAARW